MGKLIFFDAENGVSIFAGNIFEGKTVKGSTNLIVAMRVLNGHMYYMHGDTGKKIPIEQFVSAVLYGELIPRKATEIDTERLSMCAIGLDSIANRRKAEETINYYGEGAEERFRQDA
jgi:hypothetical protein